MGTHPIFESDFDCLTDKCNLRKTRTLKLFCQEGKNQIQRTQNNSIFTRSDLLERVRVFMMMRELVQLLRHTNLMIILIKQVLFGLKTRIEKMVVLGQVTQPKK